MWPLMFQKLTLVLPVVPIYIKLFAVRISISIVTFKSSPALLAGTLHSLSKAIGVLREQYDDLHCFLSLIDNESKNYRNLHHVETFLKQVNQGEFDDLELQVAESNLGYGRGHNLAISKVDSDYHIILNPDVSLADDSLVEAINHLQAYPDVGLVSPNGTDGEGSQLYLCKRYPKIFDLVLRGFAPQGFKRFFARRLADYEMHDVVEQGAGPVTVPIASGCCMVIRTSLLNEVGGFDEDYFLYFEDFDLSLRLGKQARLVYLPEMKIIHYGGHAAGKGLWHILLFVTSAVKFYRRHGWCWI
jgi:GT2 family glycosyltransferase